MTKTPIGRLQPGDEIFEKRGRRLIALGTVRDTVKDVATRSITVRLVGGGGFAQNWAAKVLVK